MEQLIRTHFPNYNSEVYAVKFRGKQPYHLSMVSEPPNYSIELYDFVTQ
ncbi:hypothetical protein SBF1_7970002 [Candidatus Desulfosporosinus infrequens]|uniref:Uncharacterized protein n=1 Tax=Candidatus Desulfosporosinus infrequens TaxID=2043169 RepID=A0A2U3LSG1_9FIRM|nr:hypothetical protein SBF1_7970002 [Candidatus Desulfosporosinus infrequens]